MTIPLVRRAMILAAGYGTRLRPLTDERPKPLVPVGDRPLLAHVGAGLLTRGIDELVMNTHYRSVDFESDIHWLRAKVHVLQEVEIRGTAGGIAGARDWVGEAPLLVVNGDILCRPPVAEALAQANEGLTLVVERRPGGGGTVGLGAGGQVVRLRGRVFGEEMTGADYVGVAVLGARCLDSLPERGCLVGDWAIPELERGGPVGTLELEGGWLDVGSLGAYQRANLLWLEEHVKPARHWFDLENVAGTFDRSGSWIGPGARVGPEVLLERSVVGSGAVVEGAGRVVRCVLWPGAKARAPLEDVVVTSSGRIVSCLDSAPA